jgi:hypothetical protein
VSETSTANPAVRADEAAARTAGPTGDPVVAADPMAVAVARWREDLTAAAGRDALVDYRDLATATLDLATAHPSGLAQFLAGRPTRLSNLFREPGALTAARKRARDIRLTAARLVDQHGVGGSYLASGMVRWRPDPLGDPVVAPVLLRPLKIKSRGAGQVDDDLDLEPEVRVNPALVRLLSEHGVGVDPARIESLAAGEHGFNPRPALTALREAAAHLPGFALTDRTVIGIFVDVVPALLADLDGAGPALGDHPVVRALATGVPLPDAKSDPDDDTHAGGHVPFDVAFQVVDLDRDQRAVIEAVAKGRSVHVAAPPGSGATRMLTQLVVTEAGRGRRVLFVTSQRAEAAGVVEGLEAVGLAGLVSDPGGLLTGYRRRRGGRGSEQVEAFGDLSGPRPDPTSAAEQLRTLAEQRLALHRVVERWGVSLSEALHALARLSSGPRAPRTTVRLGPDEPAWLRGEERTSAAVTLRELADLGAFERGVGDSPWEGASLATEQEAVAALVAAERLNAEGIPRLREEAVRAASAAGLASPATVAECGRQLVLLLAVRATLDVFTPAVYERSVADLIAATATNEWRERNDVKMSALERRRWRKQARDLLRPGSHPADLHQALIRVQDERNQWQQLASVGGWPRVPTGLAETESAYEAVRADCARLEAALPGANLQNLTLDELAATVERLARRDDLTTTLPARVAARAKLERLGLGPLLADLRERQVPAVRVVDELELCWWASVLEHLLSSPLGHQQLTSPADVVRARQALYAATADAVRDADRARAASACTVVSPLALPEMAPMGRRYDLVVLAAAHLCAVPEGVIAMARGSQVVVVGDPNGLPPVGLDFNADETASAVEPDEQDQPRVSVLAATAGVLPSLALTHQHRMPSQLAGLAAKPPEWSVPAAESVVRLELVADGTGRPDAEGGVESVDAEVRRVVDLVLEHARTRPGESLGVLAVTRHHARRIADAMRAELPEHPDVMDFFMRPRGEPFVVTDLPRCEDTVRDTVILSIGFGRTTRGRVLHRFGPLDTAGGEWALAVGATRARRRITVVSCFAADALDPEKLRTPGARALQRLLQATAQPDAGDHSPAGTGAKLDPMLDDLAKRLHDKGFEIEPGDHRPGWPDLAVRRGEGRPVAVMTDSRWLPGAVTSDVDAACELVGDDLSVAEHLRRFGWQVVSESSLDLFTDADAVVKAVQEAAGDQPAR